MRKKIQSFCNCNLALWWSYYMKNIRKVKKLESLQYGLRKLKTLNYHCLLLNSKVENILKGSLDPITSPSTSVKVQIMGWKICLRYKRKTLLGLVNKLLKTKSLLTSPSNVLSLHLTQTFLPITWIFTEG